MKLKLACKDIGEPTCPFVAHGGSTEELMESIVPHAKEVHGYTDEQLQSPETVAAVRAAIQEE